MADAETVTLYRAVSLAEYNDIAEHRAFRTGPNSMTGKWFSMSLDGAMEWGKQLYEQDPFLIVTVTLSATAMNSVFVVDYNLDMIAPARYVELATLAQGTIHPLDDE